MIPQNMKNLFSSVILILRPLNDHKDLLENSELFRMVNLIEQCQNKTSGLIISKSILDKEV